VPIARLAAAQAVLEEMKGKRARGSARGAGKKRSK
jgi:hypothetical protein